MLKEAVADEDECFDQNKTKIRNVTLPEVPKKPEKNKRSLLNKMNCKWIAGIIPEGRPNRLTNSHRASTYGVVVLGGPGLLPGLASMAQKEPTEAPPPPGING